MAIITIGEYDVVVDEDDLVKIKPYKWYVRKQYTKDCQYFSARIPGNRNLILLHRYIMGCTYKDGILIDHINKNTLDCRKCNLRKSNHSENARNCRNHIKKGPIPSKYKGVYWDTRHKVWASDIKFEGKHYGLGLYNTEQEAARAYDIASLYFGKEFSTTNFAKSEYEALNLELEFYKVRSHKRVVKSSNYIGVHLCSKGKPWQAKIRRNNIEYNLGCYLNEIDAARAYDKKSYELFGDRAKLNFPIDSIPKA